VWKDRSIGEKETRLSARSRPAAIHTNPTSSFRRRLSVGVIALMIHPRLFSGIGKDFYFQYIT
jgi:hypothetical protein